MGAETAEIYLHLAKMSWHSKAWVIFQTLWGNLLSEQRLPLYHWPPVSLLCWIKNLALFRQARNISSSSVQHHHWGRGISGIWLLEAWRGYLAQSVVSKNSQEEENDQPKKEYTMCCLAPRIASKLSKNVKRCMQKIHCTLAKGSWT